MTLITIKSLEEEMVKQNLKVLSSQILMVIKNRFNKMKKSLLNFIMKFIKMLRI